MACPFSAVLPYTNTGDIVQYQAFDGTNYREKTTTVGTPPVVADSSFSAWALKTVGTQKIRTNVAFSFTLGSELPATPAANTAVNVTIS